jgi:hydrogenase-4 component B
VGRLALALVGRAGRAGLPPLNGFVSEWLLLQSFLFTPACRAPSQHAGAGGRRRGRAGGGAGGYVMVKFFGVIFLGQPREEKLAQAHDAGALGAAGLVWLAPAASRSACCRRRSSR